MKISIILFAFQFFLLPKGNAQEHYNLPDSIKPSLQLIQQDMRLPCQYDSKFNRRENGKPFFTIKDSCQVEFDFYKLNTASLNILDPTYTGPTDAYFKDILQKNDTLKAYAFTQLPGSKDDAYAVYQIQCPSGEFYQLLAREGNTFLSIKLWGNTTSNEDRLNKLKVLYSVNKD